MDGTYITQQTINNFHDSSLPLHIGARDNGAGCTGITQSVEGQIDEVAIWNDSLSAEEISQLYSQQLQNHTGLSSSWTPHWDSIVGYWNFDGTWNDQSGNNNHGIPGNNQGANDNLPTFTPGKVGEFGGVFDDELALQYVEINNSSTLEDVQEQSFTIQAWYNPEELPNNTNNRNNRQMIIGKQGFHLGLIYLNDGQFRLTWYDSSNVLRPANSGKTYDPGQFYHLVGVIDYEAGFTYLYVNGQRVARHNISAYTLREYGTNPWRIGAGNTITADANYSWFSDGVIDDVAIWSTSLSQEDVTQIYQRQKQKYAGHYDSEVIDLGAVGSWTHLSAQTPLPFAKELTPLSGESAQDYDQYSGSIYDGLVALWLCGTLTNPLILAQPMRLSTLQGMVTMPMRMRGSILQASSMAMP